MLGPPRLDTKTCAVEYDKINQADDKDDKLKKDDDMKHKEREVLNRWTTMVHGRRKFHRQLGVILHKLEEINEISSPG